MIFFLSWRSGFQRVAVVLSIVAVLSACSPVRQGFFRPQTNAASRLTTDAGERVVPADTVPTPAEETEAHPAKPPTTTVSDRVGEPTPASPSITPPTKPLSYQHRNPESRSIRRLSRLFTPIPIAHVAPKRQTAFDQHNPARKVHRLALVALGLGVLAYIPLLVVNGGTLVWVLSFVLPLAAVMLGVASLATINRNKDRFRGKGWAIAAVMVGTGVLGLALVALAALSTSKMVWENR